MATSAFPCCLVRKLEDGSVVASIEHITRDDLPPGDVLIEVAFSSLNYKDALACQGHPGVVKRFPHVPGIDCAGTIVESSAEDYPPGTQVLVTGYELGSGAWGGYSAFVRVPVEWVVPLPEALSVREAMIYGTAGFTAAQAVMAILGHGVEPSRGEVVVTGATGGVGSISVAILASLGYNVTAVTGKRDLADFLHSLGARQVVGRSEVSDQSERALLTARWAAAVDTVGGVPLVTILRSTMHRGCVAACGLVAGDQLRLTVHPFILRGVTLAGIDSAKCPRPQRLEVWQRLAGPWRIDQLEDLAHEIDLSQLAGRVEQMLSGRLVGRTLVRPVLAG